MVIVIADSGTFTACCTFLGRNMNIDKQPQGLGKAAAQTKQKAYHPAGCKSGALTSH